MIIRLQSLKNKNNKNWCSESEFDSNYPFFHELPGFFLFWFYPDLFIIDFNQKWNEISAVSIPFLYLQSALRMVTVLMMQTKQSATLPQMFVLVSSLKWSMHSKIENNLKLGTIQKSRLPKFFIFLIHPSSLWLPMSSLAQLLLRRDISSIPLNTLSQRKYKQVSFFLALCS